MPETSGRVEQVGNVYHQVITLGPIRVATRWEAVRVDPQSLAERPRPAPPWTTVETGQLPIFGAWRSTTRYDAVKAGTLITHDLDLVLMRPLLAVAFRFLGRRLRHWIEAARD